MGFQVLKGGFLTTVQDLGRYGYQSQGFGAGGVMDTMACRVANLLVGNPENEAVLEITLLGPELAFTAPTVIAITGGDFGPALNGEPVKMYTALPVKEGDVLAFGGVRSGTRGYIAFAGRLDIPVVMGSRSTNLKSGVGGFQGRKLAAGEVICERIRRPRLPNLAARTLPGPDYGRDDGRLRVVMGPQDALFTEEGIETFLGAAYRVTAESDRMGCRLEGPAIRPKGTSDILSDGIAPGSIQISSAGKPIVLLADRQTTGGYAKIATVISVDIPRLVQMATGREVRFSAVSVQEAQRLYREEAAGMAALRSRIRDAGKGLPARQRVANRLLALYDEAVCRRDDRKTKKSNGGKKGA